MYTKKIILIAIISLTNFMLQSGLSAQVNSVSQAEMQKIYDEVKTPFKYGLVVVPEDKTKMTDCPVVFRHKNKWLMTYFVFDGKGYETWLAESENLLNWKTKGRILSFRNGAWDSSQRGAYPALPDMEWARTYKLQSYKGKYWMTYIGGANSGYEAVPLKIGLAWTKKNNLGKAIEWESQDTPLLSPEDKNRQWFDSITQYKSTVYWDKSKTLGAEFVMFYNAAGINPTNGLKAERIGIALSDNMTTWKRYDGNPVFAHEEKNTITGDAHIQKLNDLYVMFYFSAHNPTRKYKAYNTFAVSRDLIYWYDWQGDDLVIPSEEYDKRYAHKSYVVKWKGVTYHYYCAVNNNRQRGIAVATSKDMGKSEVDYPSFK